MTLWPFGGRQHPKKKRGPEAVKVRLAYGPLGAHYVAAATGYHSAVQARRSGASSAVGATSDAHTRYDIETIRAESQRLGRENPIAQGIISRLTDFVVGDGWNFDSRDPQRAGEVNAAWWQFWSRPDVRGIDSGAELERKLVAQVMEDGAALILWTGSRIQIIAADRVWAQSDTNPDNGNRIESGIELDAAGRIVAYWVRDVDASGQFYAYTSRRIDARDCYYYSIRRRADQTVGVPPLQACFAMLHRIGDVLDSEAAAWQLLSRIAIAVNRKDGPLLAQAETTDPAASGMPRIQTFDEAMIVHGQPGDTVTGIERNIPGANFENSIKTFLRLMGLPLGLSLEFVLMIWSDTNYSSGRASTRQVQRAMQPFIVGLAGMFEWLFDRWFAAQIGAGVLPLGTSDAHAFAAPPYKLIDDEKDVRAKRDRMAAGLSTLTEELLVDGKDPAKHMQERATELTEILRLCREINAGTPGANVQPKDFADWVSAGVASTNAPEALNGAQITAAVDIMVRLREGQLEPIPATELLVGVGIDRTRSVSMVAATPVGADPAGDLQFKRDVVRALLADPTINDYVTNRFDIPALIDESGIPAGAVTPPLPVIAADGQREAT